MATETNEININKNNNQVLNKARVSMKFPCMALKASLSLKSKYKQHLSRLPIISRPMYAGQENDFHHVLALKLIRYVMVLDRSNWFL